MSFTQFFESLSHEINDSRAGRRARFQEIRTDVEDFLDTFRSKRKQMAKDLKHDARELRRKLRGDDKARVKAAHEMMGEIRTRIGAIFSHTHDLLGAFKREHQDMAKGLREQLHDFASDLRRGGEIFRGNSASSSPKESRKKKRA